MCLVGCWQKGELFWFLFVCFGFWCCFDFLKNIFLEIEMTKCLTVIQGVILATWQIQLRLIPTSISEFIQCWTCSRQSLTLAICLFTTSTYQLKMVTIPCLKKYKMTNENYSNLQNDTCVEVRKKIKHFALVWCCNLAAWWVEFTVSFCTGTFQISEAQHKVLSVVFITKRIIVSAHIWASLYTFFANKL